MSTIQITYIVFGIVIIVALAFDLGLLSKKNKTISIKTALYQTLFWVTLSILFFGFSISFLNGVRVFNPCS